MRSLGNKFYIAGTSPTRLTGLITQAEAMLGGEPRPATIKRNNPFQQFVLYLIKIALILANLKIYM